MTFGALIKVVQNYIRNDSDEDKDLIKDFINEAVTDFIHEHDWKNLLRHKTFTRDDTGYYDLDTIISGTDPPFESEYKLIVEAASDSPVFEKADFETYYAQESSNLTYVWSIYQGKIYISGSGDITLFYFSKGYPSTLSADSDENLVIQYYPQEIKHWTAWLYYDWLGDDKSAAAEASRLARKIQKTRAYESRTEKHGRKFIISAHNR